RQAALEVERVAAPGLFVELMSHPPARRNVLLRSRGRFHSWGVFELIIERSLEMGSRDPAASEELALIALQISEHLDFASYGLNLVEDLRARLGLPGQFSASPVRPERRGRGFRKGRDPPPERDQRSGGASDSARSQGFTAA